MESSTVSEPFTHHASHITTRRVIVARVAGFCFGVQRAVDKVMEARRERFGRLTSLGPIVHNGQVVEKLAASGVETAADLGEVRDGAVILSAHGVAPETRAQAVSQGLQVIDVTCPFVTRVHKTAVTLVAQGYKLLVLGDKRHTEVRGIVGAVRAAGGECTVVRGPEDIKGFDLGRRVGIVTQTTQRAEDFGRLVAEVSKRAFDVRAFNTICNATDELQEAAVELARKVDVVLVVGGRKSANTAHLRAICEAEGVPAYHIETADEIQESWLAGREVVGITGGASTPDWLIEAAARRVNGGELPEGLAITHPDEKMMEKFFGNSSNLGGRELAA
jgi:small subunit ribosomal protein S1